MEQPNLMGNGMAPGNMMMNSMQRPQSGNPEQQMHARIMENLRQKQASVPQGGWQTTFDLAQRALRILQLVSGLRMLQQDANHCLHVAQGFEERCFIDSPNKEVYYDTMAKKMGEIHQRRQQAAQQAMQGNQMGMPMGNNNNMGMPQNGMGNVNNMQNLGLGNGMNMNMNNMSMGGMNMSGMGNNGMNMGMPNQMGGNGQQNPNFPAQLQRQMQPSPLPQQNQQPPNNTLDPSALQNPQMPNQMMGQPQNMPQQTPRPKQPGPNLNPSQMAGNGPVGQDVLNHARRMYESMSEEKRNQARNAFMNNLNDQQKASMSKDGDPLFKYLIVRAKEQFRQRQNAANQQNGGNMQMNGNNNMGMNASNAQQTPSQPSFDFTSLMGQQQNAIKSQESGGEVVPASNNNNSRGLGGQMNVSQSVNPQQLLANQNSQGGNGPNQNQVQFLAMQQRMAQEKQRQMMQNQMSQQQGMASQQGQNQNQLHGQRGGLNAPNALNGGQVNSPAMNMNMLNRPMAPPGQTTPSTPQPNRPQMPQTPVNNPVNQLTQHHQSMVNQNKSQVNQGGQGATPQQQIMMSNFPPLVKERLAALPPQQLQEMIVRIRQNPQQYASILNGLQNAGSGVAQQNMGVGGQQMGNQQQMMQGMQPNMTNAVPNFNSQPPPNQNQQQQQGPNNAQAMNMHRMQQQQVQLMRQRAMDLGNFAKPVPQNLGIQVPPEARTWGDIKRHIQENQAVMPPNLLEKLHTFQQQWYTANPDELRQATTQLQQQMAQARQAQQGMQQQGQPQMPPSARPPSAQPAPNGQAPPAQMVPPNAQMQQQQPNQNGAVPNLNQMQKLQPTMDEIAMFRAKVPNAGSMSDDQIRQIVMRRKQQAYVQAQAQQHQQQQQQQMQAAQQAQSMRRAQALANGGQPSAPDANMQQQQQQQQQRPGQPQQPPNQQMNMQGQKRQQSSSDDVMEIPNPNQPPQNNAQRPGAPPMVVKPPTKAEWDKMDQAERMMMTQRMKQLEALRKAQGGLVGNQGPAAPQQPQAQQPQQPAAGQPKPPGQPQAGPPAGVSGPEMQSLENRIKELWEEVRRTTPKGPPITLDGQGLEQVQVSLKRLWSAVYNLDRTFYPALRAPQLGEEKVKQAMKARIVVEQNAKDKDGNTRDYLSVGPADLKTFEMFIGQYFTALKELKARQDAARAAAAGAQPAQQQQQPAQTAAQPAKPQPPAAPERKPSQSQIRKQAAAANKAPPAPTDNTKTFDWGAQSPQGVPKYEANRTELTADKLKLPPQKKRRTGGQVESAESTPAAQTSTPQATGASPSVGGPKGQPAGQPTKLQPQAKVEAPKFKCDDILCDFSIRGFETQEQLNQHKEMAHKPIEDPLQFLQDALSTAEKTLQAEKPAITQKAASQLRGKPMPAAVKKEGQTPDIKTEALTPRPGSSVGKPSAKPTPILGKKAAETKTLNSVEEVSENEKTLLESMASKISFDLPILDAPPALPVEAPTDNNVIWEDLLMTATNPQDWSHDLATFCNADWSLRPEEFGLESSPELTPSDGTSQSSRESDISASERLRICFEWDAFGNGDTGVPEGLLRMQGLRMGEKDGEGGGEKKDELMFDWQEDMGTWDALFGANAGLEGVGDEDGLGMVL